VGSKGRCRYNRRFEFGRLCCVVLCTFTVPLCVLFCMTAEDEDDVQRRELVVNGSIWRPKTVDSY
jgi:hypothetical protein